MLKVGDKVRVRKDLKYGDYIQGYYVTDDMLTKVGQVVTISSIFHEGIKDYMCYEVEELHSFGVAFTDAMFELEVDIYYDDENGELVIELNPEEDL